MHGAVKFKVDVPENHVITLPDEVPAGPAEVIVLVNAPASTLTAEQRRAIEYVTQKSRWAPPLGTPATEDLVREDRAR